MHRRRTVDFAQIFLLDLNHAEIEPIVLDLRSCRVCSLAEEVAEFATQGRTTRREADGQHNCPGQRLTLLINRFETIGRRRWSVCLL
jgi:hypothetical protein